MASSTSKACYGASRRIAYDPRSPRELYHPQFSIGLIYDQQSTNYINELRTRYDIFASSKKETFVRTRSWLWTGTRLCYNFPIEYKERCKEVPTTYAKNQAPFSMSIGAPFLGESSWGSRNKLYAVGFHILSSEFHEVYGDLLYQFRDIKDHLARKNPYIVDGSYEIPWQTRFHIKPKAIVCKATQEEAESVYRELCEMSSPGLPIATATEFQLLFETKREVRSDPDYVEKFIRFSFGGNSSVTGGFSKNRSERTN